MRVLGIDPGVHGGLAIVAIYDGVTPQLVDAIDVPAMLLAITPVPGVILPKAAPITTTEVARITA